MTTKKATPLKKTVKRKGGFECPKCQHFITNEMVEAAKEKMRRIGWKPCPKGCGREFGARAMKYHVPRCDGEGGVKLPAHGPHKSVLRPCPNGCGQEFGPLEMKRHVERCWYEAPPRLKHKANRKTTKK